MLSVAFRSDWGYLTRHAAEAQRPWGTSRQQDRAGSSNYYTAGQRHGEPPGLWWGRGAALLGLSGEVREETMERLYGALEHPESGEALGTRPRTYATFAERLGKLLAREPDPTPERRVELELAAHKAHREARHYADLTFSPTKSWSVLHAALEHAGRHSDAAAVWAAWLAETKAGLAYLMDEAGYSRAGYHGAKVGEY